MERSQRLGSNPVVKIKIKCKTFPRIYRTVPQNLGSILISQRKPDVKLVFFPRSITSLPRRQLMNLHNNEAGRRVGFDQWQEFGLICWQLSIWHWGWVLESEMGLNGLGWAVKQRNYYSSLQDTLILICVNMYFLCHGDYFAMWFGGRSLV